MPVVRAYGQRQVETRPLADTTLRVRPDPDAFGAQLGETAAKIGATALNAEYAVARQKADQVALLAADNQLAAWESTRLYDPQQGAFAVKGKDALGLPDTLQKEYDDLAGKIEAGLSGDRQKIAFQRARLNRWQNIDLSLKRHVFSESQQYDQQETKAFVELSTSNAVANATDPARVGQELARATAAVRDHAKRNGIGPELMEQQVQAVSTAIHTGVIDRLLSAEQSTAAQTYYEETKHQISGDAQARIEKALEEGTLRGNAQTQTDAIMAGSKSMSDALEQARAIDDPKLRDAVQQRVEHEWSIRKQIARESEENLMVSAANLIDRGGIKAVQPSLWTQLEPGQRVTLENYAKRHAKGEDGDGTKSGLIKWAELRALAVDNPEQFKKTNITAFLGTLGKTEYKQLIDLQQDMRKGNTKADEDLSGYRTTEQIVNDTLDLNDIPRTGQKANPEVVARFKRTLDERVATLQRSTGKKATNADIQAIADDVVSKGVAVPNSWFWQMVGSPVTGKRLIEVEIGDIPRATRKQIEDALRRGGAAVTPANVVQIYIDQQARGGK